MEIYGFDASHYQDIDFNKVKASGLASFVMLKASEGTSYVDPSFETYFANAKAVGLNVGAYHYGNFGSVPEALAEAKHFEDSIKGKVFSYPIALDLEENKEGASVQQLTDAAIAFCEYFESKGYFIEVYSGKDFYENSLDPARLARFASWLARYGVSALGRASGMWQYSSSGHILGVSGDVDLDVAYQDYSMVNPKPPVAPKPVQPVKPSTPKPAVKPVVTKTSGIPVLGTIQIVNVANSALIIDRPSSTNSKNLATVTKGTKLQISGSVPGFYEVIWNGQRAYVNSKFATKI